VKRQYFYLFRKCLKLVLRVDVLPDALHVIPVLHNTMLHGIPDRHQTSMFLSNETKQITIDYHSILKYEGK
jgi:hypothetical protein